MAAVDILSDEEDELLCPAPCQEAAEAAEAAPAPAPAPAEPPALRSVVVANVDLDSDDEEEMLCAKAPAAPTPAAPASAIAAPTSTLPASVGGDDDDEEEMLCAKEPVRPAPTPQRSSTPAPAISAGDVQEKDAKPAKPKVKAKPKAKADPKSESGKAKTEPTKTQTDSEPAIPPVKASEATNAPEELKTLVPTKEPKAGSSQPKAAAKKAPEKGKEKKLTKDEMEVKVLEYMRQQNRPYNAQNVFDNLHGAVPKGSVQTIMESLVTEGKLLIKEYGKIKVFLVSQSLVVGGDDATALQQEVDEASKKRKALGNDLDTTRKEMSQVASKHAAAKEAKESAAEALTLEARAKQLKGSGEEQVEESEVRAVEAAFTQVHQTWRKRKRLCMDTLRTLGEAMSTRTDQLLEQYGVDTDEDCGQTLPLEFSQ